LGVQYSICGMYEDLREGLNLPTSWIGISLVYMCLYYNSDGEVYLRCACSGLLCTGYLEFECLRCRCVWFEVCDTGGCFVFLLEVGLGRVDLFGNFEGIVNGNYDIIDEDG
jgi:hypothetical protein